MFLYPEPSLHLPPRYSRSFKPAFPSSSFTPHHLQALSSLSSPQPSSIIYLSNVVDFPGQSWFRLCDLYFLQPAFCMHSPPSAAFHNMGLDTYLLLWWSLQTEFESELVHLWFGHPLEMWMAHPLQNCPWVFMDREPGRLRHHGHQRLHYQPGVTFTLPS